jgi:hypothetical protein
MAELALDRLQDVQSPTGSLSWGGTDKTTVEGV